MTGDAQTRPTTEAERALVARTLRADRILVVATVIFFVGTGVLVSVLTLSWGEPVGTILMGGICFGGAAAFWWLGRSARNRAVVRSGSACRIEGEAEERGWGLDDIQTDRRTAIGGCVATVPAHWRGYIAQGVPHSVWIVETTGAPVVVAIEHGPSADADAALGADHLLDSRMRLGKWFTVLVFLTIFPILFILSIAGFNVNYIFTLISIIMFTVAGAYVTVDMSRRQRLHQRYFDAGARFAASPPNRTRHRLLTAVAASVIAVGGCALASLIVGANLFAATAAFVPFAALVSLLRPADLSADTSNPGSGVLRPAAP